MNWMIFVRYHFKVHLAGTFYSVLPKFRLDLNLHFCELLLSVHLISIMPADDDSFVCYRCFDSMSLLEIYTHVEFLLLIKGN